MTVAEVRSSAELEDKLRAVFVGGSSFAVAGPSTLMLSMPFTESDNDIFDSRARRTPRWCALRVEAKQKASEMLDLLYSRDGWVLLENNGDAEPQLAVEQFSALGLPVEQFAGDGAELETIFSSFDGALRASTHIGLDELTVTQGAWKLEFIDRWHPLATETDGTQLVEILDDKHHVMRQLW